MLFAAAALFNIDAPNLGGCIAFSGASSSVVAPPDDSFGSSLAGRKFSLLELCDNLLCVGPAEFRLLFLSLSFKVNRVIELIYKFPRSWYREL